MRRDPSKFRERFNRWKNGEQVYNAGVPMTDDEYAAVMERVAIDNNSEWNKYRLAEGGRALSEDEEVMRVMNDHSYDYRGYYNKYPNAKANASTHWPDEFKTYLHPTFSDESIYSGKKSQFNPHGIKGGHWYGDTFIPSNDQLKIPLM